MKVYHGIDNSIDRLINLADSIIIAYFPDKPHASCLFYEKLKYIFVSVTLRELKENDSVDKFFKNMFRDNRNFFKSATLNFRDKAKVAAPLVVGFSWLSSFEGRKYLVDLYRNANDKAVKLLESEIKND